MASLNSVVRLVSCLALMLLFFTFTCESREILVGGRENSWKVPPSPDDLNDWSGKMRFLIGDTLVLKYDPKNDSVLQVTEEHYKTCNTSNPIKSYDGGDTKIPLNRSGPFYFISGVEGHCEKGQKVVVTVLSPQHSALAHPPVASPAPALGPSPAAEGLFPIAPVPTAGGCRFNGGGAVGVAVGLGSLVGLALFM